MRLFSRCFRDRCRTSLRQRLSRRTAKTTIMEWRPDTRCTRRNRNERAPVIPLSTLAPHKRRLTHTHPQESTHTHKHTHNGTLLAFAARPPTTLLGNRAHKGYTRHGFRPSQTILGSLQCVLHLSLHVCVWWTMPVGWNEQKNTANTNNVDPASTRTSTCTHTHTDNFSTSMTTTKSNYALSGDPDTTRVFYPHWTIWYAQRCRCERKKTNMLSPSHNVYKYETQYARAHTDKKKKHTT